MRIHLTAKVWSLFIPSKYYWLLRFLWTLCITKIDGTSATHIYLPTLFILFLTLLCGTFYKTTTTSKQKQVRGYQKISKYFRKNFWVVQKVYVSRSSSSLVDHLSFFRETKHKKYNLGRNLLYPSENSLKITIWFGNNIYQN